MSKVKVHRVAEAVEASANPVFEKMEEARRAIRERAFQLFQQRGAAPNGELDDWLQAERDLLFVPHADINESEKGFRMTIAAAGFDSTDIDVIASPHQLLIEAKTQQRLEPRRDRMRAGSLEPKILYRLFELTTPIETDQVTARIDEGSLTIEAPKRTTRFPVRAAAA